MGLLLDEDQEAPDPIIVTDILGLEDFFGSMDFKVCGDEVGVSTFQLDIKCGGLTLHTLERALMQAREGRLHVLKVMNEACPGPRPQLRASVPRLRQFKINPNFIGKLIGPSGRQVRSIIEEFQLSELDVSEKGVVSVTAPTDEALLKATQFITEMMKDETKASNTVEYKGPMPEPGTVFRDVEVKGVQSFGVFVEILPGLQGLCHVSELTSQRVVSVEAAFKLGERMDVKLLSINEKGQLKLSRKAVLIEEGKEKPRERPAPANKGPGQERSMNGTRTGDRGPRGPPARAKLDVSKRPAPEAEKQAAAP